MKKTHPQNYQKTVGKRGKMRNIGLAIASIFITLVVVSLADVHETFLECLLDEQSELENHSISAVIYTPRNSSYPSVLQSYIRNLRFNESTTPKPELILTALHVSHVQVAILCAKLHGIQMKIRSGGHDFEGLSCVSLTHDVPFFILDMFNLRAINVSIQDETAWVQVGATLGELYYRIAEKSNVHGFPAGVCPTVGVGGHFSGGGYGNMMRKYGLSVDNIIDAEIVDARGRILNRASMGEDLFWAITGGGGSSFGVVLAYKIMLARVPPKVTVFRVEKTYEQNATEVVHKWTHVADKLHEHIFIRMILDVVKNARTGQNTNRASFVALFLGDSATLLPLMSKSFPELGLQQKDCTGMSWVESVLFWTDFPIGTPVNALLSRIHKLTTYQKRKSDYLKNPIPKQGIELIFKKMLELQTPVLTFNPYGGKMAEIPASAKPFPHRTGNIAKLQYAVNWHQSGAKAANHYINLARTLYGSMTPYVSKSPREAFLNYRDLDLGIITHNGPKSYLEGMVYGIKYFKNNFKRLVEIKTKVDPENFFRNEQSIPIFPSIKR